MSDFDKIDKPKVKEVRNHNKVIVSGYRLEENKNLLPDNYYSEAET